MASTTINESGKHFLGLFISITISSNIPNSPFLKVKVKGIGCNELAEAFVTIVIPIFELEKRFFPTSFQIVSYLLQMQYKVFDKVVFSCFIILLFICFENEGF